jgi:thioredoxin
MTILLTIKNTRIMKRIFVIITCAALMMACGGNKAQNSECGECKTECCGDKQECDKKCDKQDCEKKCDKQQCDKQCENKCSKQECEKKCDKQECTEQAVGCIHLDTDGFASKVADLSKEWKYLGDKPAVVDFYADWCGPCKAISPILEELAKEYAGELYIYKINVDNDPYIADAFNIQAIPTLLFIPMEGRYKVQTGGVAKEELVNMIKENCFK